MRLSSAALAWDDEPLGRFEKEVANGWQRDDAPFAEHLLGAYFPLVCVAFPLVCVAVQIQ